ncbi:hypothetical protein NGF19_19975 [Streptomyces sp. RY43-2]|uniref:Phosphopantetheinyl transferase n=1 Tax=Streptomyces macrolidinus TaxID=2952607 RepID=A0ABT0ZHI0_9ACTN|nr:hypothetical protein [Streptomyces macrolidinus]MCN9243049.1 hypothetical protein [Streptomyces macrolidinus]
MGALMGLVMDPVMRAGTGTRARLGDGAAVIDCVVTHHPRLPRDRMGHHLSRSGRSLIIEAVRTVYGLGITARDLARDDHKRWSVPAHGLTVSVAHCDAYSAVALSTGPVVGVDLQDERDRPHAMRWLGELLGRTEPATIRDFAECEALIKASHVTKETFAGVRLPDWRPGWRPTNVTPYHVRSAALVPRQATFALSRRPARSPELCEQGGPPLAAPDESPRTSSTRASARHSPKLFEQGGPPESTHRTPLLDGQTSPAEALAPAMHLALVAAEPVPVRYRRQEEHQAPHRARPGRTRQEGRAA